MKKHVLAFLCCVQFAFLSGIVGLSDLRAENFELLTRSRAETKKESGRFHTLTKKQSWDAQKTAVIVCDMWDLHHCLNATRRGAEMAPRMNDILIEARKRGAIVIHAPSSCMKFYEKHPARLRALKVAPSTKLPEDIGKWCYKIPSEEQGTYPIDQSDGGEDDDPEEHAKWAEKLKKMGRNPRAPWKRQTELLAIEDQDYISDNGEEIWSIMEKRGIENVIMVGVHTNMCVLGRPFGLRQMSKNGKNVVLVRDMTDTMYNPGRRPFVSHFTGTDLIVEHIEKWVCPTVTSDQILGGETFRFKNDKRPHLVIVMAEREYKTNETLPKFAAEHLGHAFTVSVVHANVDERNDLPGIEVLNDADIALISVRRRVLPKDQMAVVRKFIESGKPVVGVRTANHAFSLRGKKPPENFDAWETWDADIFGGNYTGHHGKGPEVAIAMAKGADQHPVLSGVDLKKLKGFGSLYLCKPLAESATGLLTGTIPGKDTEPVAWVANTKWGGRSFYTSIADPKDFDQPTQNRLLKNALFWAAGLEIDK
ncbi:MAG: nicotinamidase [Planctomycetaceae bacterium]|nr:nicotinamidase [Planctomycetaceae bacterium]